MRSILKELSRQVVKTGQKSPASLPKVPDIKPVITSLQHQQFGKDRHYHHDKSSATPELTPFLLKNALYASTLFFIGWSFKKYQDENQPLTSMLNIMTVHALENREKPKSAAPAPSHLRDEDHF